MDVLHRRAFLGTGLAMVATACGTVTKGDGSSRDAIEDLRIIAPAGPGGGWDQTARSMEQVLDTTGLATGIQVTNIDGAGGTVGLGKLATEKDPEVLMVTGLVMVGAVETNTSQARLENTTPLARLTAEDEVLVVPAGSPHKRLEDLLVAIREQGRGVAITGGSAGGTDHILAGLIYQAGQLDPERLNYIPYSGGGESLAALLGNKVDAGISGIAEYAEQIEAGKLRALAVSGAERSELVDAPTLQEAGLDVELTNWRGVVGPPGLDTEERKRLLDLITDMHASKQWKQQLDKRGWVDNFLAGKKFEQFLDAEVERTKVVLRDIGLL